MTSTGRHLLRKARNAGVAVIGAAGLGCNLVVGDYSVTGTHWGCVGSVTEPVGVDGGTVAITLQAAAFMKGEVLPPVTINACDQSDMTCEQAITTATTDASGAATLVVPSGFQGYLDATALDRMESLVYLSSPVVNDTTVPLMVGAYTDYTAAVMAVTGNPLPQDGAIWVNTEDCLGQPAAGVELSLNQDFTTGTDPFYFLGGSAVSASALTPPATSSDAIGGFADVMPGLPTLSATQASNGQLYAQFNAYVRKQSLTVIWLQPTPLP
jgi:hypothetical protein